MANKRRSKFLLNVITVASLMLLLVLGIVSINRYMVQRSYDQLALQRESQLADDSVSIGFSVADTSKISEKANEDVSMNNPVVTEDKPTYVYKENLNKEFLDINPDYMGWLIVNGSNIDYPFVRSMDNEYYLNRDFYGNFSDAGALFMDYRNLGNFNDQHTIIYGHNTKNGTMFHNLRYYRNEDYFNNNQEIIVSGLYETKKYRIFSVYEVSADDYFLTVNFSNKSEYGKYLKNLEELSLFRQNIELEENYKLLSLVTCSYGVNNGRTIVHAIEVSAE